MPPAQAPGILLQQGLPLAIAPGKGACWPKVKPCNFSADVVT
jgi:hypothetical protein